MKLRKTFLSLTFSTLAGVFSGCAALPDMLNHKTPPNPCSTLEELEHAGNPHIAYALEVFRTTADGRAVVNHALDSDLRVCVARNLALGTGRYNKQEHSIYIHPPLLPPAFNRWALVLFHEMVHGTQGHTLPDLRATQTGNTETMPYIHVLLQFEATAYVAEARFLFEREKLAPDSMGPFLAPHQNLLLAALQAEYARQPSGLPHAARLDNASVAAFSLFLESPEPELRALRDMYTALGEHALRERNLTMDIYENVQVPVTVIDKYSTLPNGFNLHQARKEQMSLAAQSATPRPRIAP